MWVSVFTQIGKVPSPDCLRTLGLLGADSSFSMLHLGLPLPVTVPFQLAGSALGFSWSKLIVSPDAALAHRVPVRINVISIFMIVPLVDFKTKRF